MKINHMGTDDDFFLGIMVLKGEKWAPHSKFAANDFGRALLQAEDVDKTKGIDGTKILKLSKQTGAVEKEMWISPRVQARIDAARAKQLRAGVQKTQENLSAARKASIKKT
jgi:hypothetical protein